MKKTSILLVIGMLAALPAAARTLSIAKDKVNVRSRPSLKADVIFQAPLAYPIQVQEKKGQWIRFRDWQNNTGWIYKPLISPTATTVVEAATANVRQAPTLKSPVIQQANKGQIYKVFGERGDWVKIGYYFENEVLGWIHEGLVWGY